MHSMEYLERSPEPEGYPNLEKALKLTKERVFEYATDPREFMRENGGPYNDRDVLKDLSRVEDLKRKIAQSNEERFASGSHNRERIDVKVAYVFEGIFLDNVDSNLWFGDRAKIIIPSQFDDIVHGVDGILELKGDMGGFSSAALCIDVTTGNYSTLEKKIMKIGDEVRDKKLTKIQYYRSLSQHFMGQKEKVPRLLVATERMVVKELMDLWVGGKNKVLSKHPIQMQILLSFEMQLGLLSRLASANGWNEGASIFGDVLLNIQRIIAERKSVLGPDIVRQAEVKNNKDPVYREIERHRLQEIEFGR